MEHREVKDFFDVSEKVVVITGGLGILGTQYAKTFTAAGARTAIIDVAPPGGGHELEVFFKSGEILFISADITRRPEIERAYAVIEKKWGTPDVLINNAAIDFPPAESGATFEEYPLNDWNRVLEVNLTGVLICCQVFGGAMARAGRGSIINISSIYGLVSPDQRIYDHFIKPVSYSVTKSGILNLTRYLATYWGGNGVRVNTLSPGGVYGGQPEDFVKRYASRVPLGRMAEKGEYNGAVLFLASDASRYMTGANLVIDGGWTAW